MMGAADARVAVQDLIQLNVRAQSDVVVLHPPARTHARMIRKASKCSLVRPIRYPIR
jgi:hypothetical protein